MEIHNCEPNWLQRLLTSSSYSPKVIGSDYQPLGTSWKTRVAESSLSDRRLYQYVSSECDGETTVIVAGGWCTRRGIRCNDIFERSLVTDTLKCISRRAEWSPRHSFSFLGKRNGGMLYIIGGDDGSIRSDVWVSSDRARSFRRVCEEAAWKGRIDFSAALVGDVIVICGGRIPRHGGLDSYLNDVWISHDRGASWTQACNHAAWKPRSGCAMVAIGTDLLMLGGQGEVSAFDDTWISRDLGATWAPSSTKRIPWKPRKSPKVLLDPISNELLLIGGFGADGAVLSDSWASIDRGVSWIPRNHLPEEVLPDAAATATHNGAVFVLGTKAESQTVSDLRFVKNDCLFILMVGSRLESVIPRDL